LYWSARATAVLTSSSLRSTRQLLGNCSTSVALLRGSDRRRERRTPPPVNTMTAPAPTVHGGSSSLVEGPRWQPGQLTVARDCRASSTGNDLARR
jgi:hypothetical protein